MTAFPESAVSWLAARANLARQLLEDSKRDWFVVGDTPEERMIDLRDRRPGESGVQHMGRRYAHYLAERAKEDAACAPATAGDPHDVAGPYGAGDGAQGQWR